MLMLRYWRSDADTTSPSECTRNMRMHEHLAIILDEWLHTLTLIYVFEM